jgi:hypothetical protein
MSKSLSHRIRELTLALCTVLAAGVFVGAVPAQAVNLPDNRAYEEVTPVHMNGAKPDPWFASEDGEDVFYNGSSPFTGPSGGEDRTPFAAQRTPTGWQTVGMLPPATKYSKGTFFFEGLEDYSPHDLGRNLAALADPFDTFTGLYLQRNDKNYIQESSGAGALAPATEEDTTATSGLSVPEYTIPSNIYLGASEDLTHLVYSDRPNAEFVSGFGPGQILEGYRAGGSWHYRYVGVEGPSNPDGTGNLIGECGSVLGSGSFGLGEPLIGHDTFHAISVDGSRVFFTAARCVKINFGTNEITVAPPVNELFVRINGSETIPIGEPSSTYCPYGSFTFAEFFALPPDPCANAQFEGASKDGAKVFFTSTQSEEVPGVTDTSENLYEAEVGASSVTKLTQVSAGDPGGEAQVQGVVRISDDGSHVYFVARGVLTSSPGPEGQTAQNGADNLYVSVNGSIAFIGDLCSGLNRSGVVADQRCPGSGVDGLWRNEQTGSDPSVLDDHAAWAVPFGSTSSDGHTLVFQTYAQLTSDDTDTARDVYEYNSQTGTLVRVSTGRNGFDNNGNNNNFDASLPLMNTFSRGAYADSELQTSNGGEEFGYGRPVSNDGSYVFFTTSEALVSEDVNNAPDVYEWHNGLVSLISDGQNLGKDQGTTNGFIAASASGRDVFIHTPDVLVPGGGTSIAGIYDARIGGGFPAANVPPPCQEDACQGSISATPSFPVPTSATYSSPEGANATATSPAVKAKPKKKSKPKKKTKKKAKHRKNNRTAKGGK